MPAKKKAPARRAVKKAAPKRKPARKTAAKKKPAAKKKKAPARKKVAAKSVAAAGKPLKSVGNPLTKTELYRALSDGTGVAKKEVAAVMEHLADLISLHLKKRGPQLFTLPGLLKVKVVRKPATKARKGINPFTGEETIFKAKPARNVVKVLALKKMKEMAN